MRKSMFFALLGVFMSGAAWAAIPGEYSADMEMRSSSGTMQGKIFTSGNKLRYEMPESIMITRLDQKKTYILMPSQKMYMEHAIDPLAGAKAGVEEGDVQREALGKEDVEGQPADKFKVTATGTSGTTVYFQWIDSHGAQVKAEAEDGSWSVIYRNVQVGSQPAELFEIPSDYQAMVMPNMADMMKEMNSQS